MKNVLIINESKKSKELLEIIINNYTDFNIIIEDDIKKLIDTYENDKYEFMIFDHSLDGSDDLINFVLTNNANQKAILLSDSLQCPISCDFCCQTFKFIRLLKPIDPKTILSFLSDKEDFICPNKNRFENIDTLEKLYELINLSDNIFYTKKELQDDKIVIKPSFLGTLRVNELKKIEELVNIDFFTFELSISNEIMIFKK